MGESKSKDAFNRRWRKLRVIAFLSPLQNGILLITVAAVLFAKCQTQYEVSAFDLIHRSTAKMTKFQSNNGTIRICSSLLNPFKAARSSPVRMQAYGAATKAGKLITVFIASQYEKADSSNDLSIVDRLLRGDKIRTLVEVCAIDGVWSVIGAQHQKKVVTLARTYENAAAITQTFQSNGVKGNMKLFVNAVSGKCRKSKTLDHQVTLDSLVSWISNESVALKLGCGDGLHSILLKGGRKFFNKNKISVVFMPWVLEGSPASSLRQSKEVIWLMKQNDLEPFDARNLLTRLDIWAWENWPSEIVWLKLKIKLSSNLVPWMAENSSLFVFQGNPNDNVYLEAVLDTSITKIPLFVHDLESDPESKTIYHYQTWHVTDMIIFLRLLHRYPAAQLIDLGAQVGAYTLTAASIGRTVVAVSCHIQDIRRLSASISKNGFDRNVTLLWNFILSQTSTISVIPRLQVSNSPPERPQVIESAPMDHLLQVINFKEAIMRINVDEIDQNSFDNSRRLFQSVNIVCVITSWRSVLKNYNIRGNFEVLSALRTFFWNHNYVPYDAIHDRRLDSDLHGFEEWPNEVVWFRQQRTDSS